MDEKLAAIRPRIKRTEGRLTPAAADLEFQCPVLWGGHRSAACIGDSWELEGDPAAPLFLSRTLGSTRRHFLERTCGYLDYIARFRNLLPPRPNPPSVRGVRLYLGDDRPVRTICSHEAEAEEPPTPWVPAGCDACDARHADARDGAFRWASRSIPCDAFPSLNAAPFDQFAEPANRLLDAFAIANVQLDHAYSFRIPNSNRPSALCRGATFCRALCCPKRSSPSEGLLSQYRANRLV